MKVEKYLDSRDIIKQLKELERIEENWLEQEEVVKELQDEINAIDDDSAEELEGLKAQLEQEQSAYELLEPTPTEKEELQELREFCKECENISSEWRYGEQLIHESVWVEYCRELCREIGDIPQNIPSYIESNIDWKGVADDLSCNYSQVVYKNEDYYLRDS